MSRYYEMRLEIDWGKTVGINGVTVPCPVLLNRIGPVLEPRPA
jgi:hypothetical protein